VYFYDKPLGKIEAALPLVTSIEMAHMAYFTTPFNYALDTKADRYTLWLVISHSMKDHPLYQFTEKPLYTNENAGFDLATAENWSGGTHLLDLGVQAMMTRADTEETVHYWLAPRSSIYKTGYIMGNSLGVIDRSYRGRVKAPVVRVDPDAKGFLANERHFQILAPGLGWIEKVQIVESLPETERGDGGFGSTGR
jgi:dUTPase